jgi:DNA processing protein
VVVVSGLALGVDSAAHEGALLAEGCTVAVLGSGVDVLYPAANADLARRLLDAGGALVSQFPEGTPPRREHFPRRNWTMAAISDLVVVVEAAEGSGALITADAALHMAKPVMAVPGSVFSPLSVGCHQLLRDGAGVVQNGRDVLAELSGAVEVLDDPLGFPARLGLAQSVPGGLDPVLQHLDDCLVRDAGELSRKLGLPFGELVARLSRLELAGRVTRRGSGYVKVHGRGTSRADS